MRTRYVGRTQFAAGSIFVPGRFPGFHHRTSRSETNTTRTIGFRRFGVVVIRWRTGKAAPDRWSREHGR